MHTDDPHGVAQQLRDFLTQSEKCKSDYWAWYIADDLLEQLDSDTNSMDNVLGRLMVACEAQSYVRRSGDDFIADVLDYVRDNILTLDGRTLAGVMRVTATWQKHPDEAIAVTAARWARGKCDKMKQSFIDEIVFWMKHLE